MVKEQISNSLNLQWRNKRPAGGNKTDYATDTCYFILNSQLDLTTENILF